jgi:AmmeMemoRadiSam system protein B
MSNDVRPAVLAGSWYPGDPGDLTLEVDGFLAAADPAKLTRGRPLLAIVPHAGYAYSGPTAGRLLGLLRDHKPATVFLLAPNHRTPLNHIALPEAAAFATPLGQVRVDLDTVQALAAHPDFTVHGDAHRLEHAVEIVLPLLQRAWGDESEWQLVPMLVPHLKRERLLEAGAELARARDKAAGPVLILVSSDFTHYGHSFGYAPFDDRPASELPIALETLDSGAILRILAGDANGLLEYEKQTGITMCGLPATTVALAAGLPAGYEAGLVDYCRSGDLNGDYSHSVSYASIIFSSGEQE